MSRTALGPYQLQAAIAALHAEASHAGDTDWPQILALYGLLERHSDNPVVTLNRAVATATVQGPRAGLALLEVLDEDQRMAQHHRLHAVRAHLLEMAGDLEPAIALYRAAARLTASAPERRHLEARAARPRQAATTRPPPTAPDVAGPRRSSPGTTLTKPFGWSPRPSPLAQGSRLPSPHCC